jgi:hypothetical protein
MPFVIKTTVTRPNKTVPFFSKFIENQTTATPEKLALQVVNDEREKLGYTETATLSEDGLTIVNTVDYGTPENHASFNQTYAQALATIKVARVAYEKSVGITRTKK